MAKKITLVEPDDDDTQQPVAAKKGGNQVMTSRGPAIEKPSGQLQVEADAAEVTQEDTKPVAIAVSPAVEVAPQIARSGNVTIIMLREVDPAPVIGHPAHGGFSFLDHGITKLDERASYRVPANVANHLVDKRLASIVAIN